MFKATYSQSNTLQSQHCLLNMFSNRKCSKEKVWNTSMFQSTSHRVTGQNFLFSINLQRGQTFKEPVTVLLVKEAKKTNCRRWSAVLLLCNMLKHSCENLCLQHFHLCLTQVYVHPCSQRVTQFLMSVLGALSPRATLVNARLGKLLQDPPKPHSSLKIPT